MKILAPKLSTLHPVFCQLIFILILLLQAKITAAREGTSEESLSELRQLRQEVSQLRQEVNQLRQEVNQFRRLQTGPGPQPVAVSPSVRSPTNAQIQLYSGQTPDDPSQILSRWKGPSPSVSVTIVGEASGRQVRICEEALKRFHIRPQADPLVEAVVETGVSTVGGRENVLRITTQQRGTVQMYRPGWTVQTLCEDALAQALRIMRSENE